jgi:phage anti-repressor protein
VANEIVRHDITVLVDSWLDAESKGEKFPVPFDTAWMLAGYSRKDNAKRKLTNSNSGLIEGEDFALLRSAEWTQEGRSSDLIVMTCDAFKQFCLMAKTPEGKQTRLYFIECEKKWKLVQNVAPEFAQEIEILHLKAEIAKQEAIKAQAEEKALALRHYVVTALPEAVQQKVLGYSVIEKVEYRDRIIHNDDIINDGSTILKKDLCLRYGLLTRNGSPDYKALNRYLGKLPPESFQLSVRIQDNNELLRTALPKLDELIYGSDRQRYIGE